VPKDYAEAIKWLRKAADQEIPDAQHDLGKIYYVGENVSKDYPKAFKWLSLAAAQGDKESARMLEELKKDMTSAEITEGQRLLREVVPRKTQSGTATN
jgi:TPR repeat protein